MVLAYSLINPFGWQCQDLWTYKAFLCGRPRLGYEKVAVSLGDNLARGLPGATLVGGTHEIQGGFFKFQWGESSSNKLVVPER